MSTKLRITVTKDILKQSADCGLAGKSGGSVLTHCAVAIAIRDVFPIAMVTRQNIWTSGHERAFSISLPKEATEFIGRFDFSSPEQRIKMPEISFEIEIPDSVVDGIDIEDVKKILENHPTLELV